MTTLKIRMTLRLMMLSRRKTNEEEDIRDFIENKHLYTGGGDTIKVEALC